MGIFNFQMWLLICLVIVVALALNCMLNYKRMPKGYSTSLKPNKEAKVIN